MLASRVSSVVGFLLPGGKEVKGDWVCGDVSGQPGRTLTVHMQGPHVGKWIDWANQDHKGDLLDLWAASKAIPLPEAIKEAKDYLGIVEGTYAPSQKVYSQPKMGITKMVTPEEMAMQFFTKKRGISQEIVDRFKVEVKSDDDVIAFPCYSPAGALINRSYRKKLPDGKKKVWQDSGCAPCLFGWQALSPEAWDKRTILLSEGQCDAMTWTQWGIPALSIPNGTGTTWIEYEWDNLAAFDHIYLSFDMDGAGSENAKKVIQRLGVHRCMIVSIPCKDANDCLLAGHTAHDAKNWVSLAKPPNFNGIVRPLDLKQRVYQELKAKVEPYTLKFFRGNWERGIGFYPHPGDVTVWTGHTGQGKTTFLTFLQVCLLSQDYKTFVASMEVKPERTIRKMAICTLEGKSPTEETMDGFLNSAQDLLVFADVVGYIDPKELLDMMKFAFMRYGCTRFFIDSLMRVKGLEENYPAQGDFMNELAAFAKTYSVWVDIVCHPRKKEGRVSEMDIKGSSLIANNADNIVSIIKNPEKDKLRKEGTLTPIQDGEMHDTEIRIDKQREVGWTGLFKLMLCMRTLRFQPQEKPRK